jgi:transcription elongation factor GreB
MSKAFTRESDDTSEEEIPSVRPQLPPGTTNYITREGAERLRSRLAQLQENRRRAADKEPNQAATADQRRLESSIRNLQSILNSVVPTDIPVDQEKVAFGASVRIRFGDGEEEFYQIVGVDETDPERGRISWISPLARALLSRRAGDKVGFQSPAGDQELTILEVSYQRP